MTTKVVLWPPQKMYMSTHSRRTFVYTHTHTTHIHTCNTYIHTHKHTHIHIYTQTNTHTYTHTQIDGQIVSLRGQLKEVSAEP